MMMFSLNFYEMQETKNIIILLYRQYKMIVI